MLREQVEYQAVKLYGNKIETLNINKRKPPNVLLIVALFFPLTIWLVTRTLILKMP